MNLKSLAAGLEFRGKVDGRRQTYYVFEGKKFYFICSFARKKRKAGYFNVVHVDAVKYAMRLVGGRKNVTSQELHKRCRTPRHIGSALEALNILYVLVAIGRAKFDRRHTGTRQLFFNVSKHRSR